MGLFRKKNNIDFDNMAMDWGAYYKDIELGVSEKCIARKIRDYDYYVDKSALKARGCSVL